MTTTIDNFVALGQQPYNAKSRINVFGAGLSYPVPTGYGAISQATYNTYVTNFNSSISNMLYSTGSGSGVFTVSPPALPTKPSPPTEITVAASGGDHTTLIDAWNAAAPNTKIILEDGIYTDATIRSFAEKATTAGTPIVIEARNSGMATLLLTSGTGNQYTFNTNYLWFCGINIHGDGTTGLGDGTTQDGGRLLRLNQGGAATQRTDVYLLNCDIGNTKGHALFVLDTDNLHIQNCCIHDVALDSPNSTRNCISLDNCSNCNIIDNEVYNTEHELISVSNGSDNLTISFNKLYACTDHAITLRESTNTRVAFNQFWNDEASIYVTPPQVDVGGNDGVFVHLGQGETNIVANTFTNYGAFVNIKGDGVPNPTGPVRIYNNSGFEAGRFRTGGNGSLHIGAVRYTGINTTAMTVENVNNAWYTLSPATEDAATLYANWISTACPSLTLNSDYNVHYSAINEAQAPIVTGGNTVQNAGASNPFTDPIDFSSLNPDFTHMSNVDMTDTGDTTHIGVYIPEWVSLLPNIDIGAIQET